MTQAELDAMMATWIYPEDFAEWGAYIIGRSPYNMVNENGTIDGVYVSDGNGGTVQIGNADGYNPTGYVTNWGLPTLGGSYRIFDIIRKRFAVYL